MWCPDLTNRKVSCHDSAVKRPVSSIVLACLSLSAIVPQADASTVKHEKDIGRSTPNSRIPDPGFTSVSFKTRLAVPSPTPTPIATQVSDSSPNTNLNCGETPTGKNKIPGWIDSAPHLTTAWVAYGKMSMSWCPATVASTSDGYDPIIYTVTLNPGAYTCTTATSTSCVISNLPMATYRVNLIATNQTGTDVVGVPTVSNTGVIFPCDNDGVTCDVPSTNQTFQTFGNTVGGLGDCTFASAADWEQLTLGLTPDPKTIQEQFLNAGGSLATGLAPSALFNYWENSGIAGTRIKSVQLMGTDQLTAMGESKTGMPLGA